MHSPEKSALQKLIFDQELVRHQIGNGKSLKIFIAVEAFLVKFYVYEPKQSIICFQRKSNEMLNWFLSFSFSFRIIVTIASDKARQTFSDAPNTVKVGVIIAL